MAIALRQQQQPNATDFFSNKMVENYGFPPIQIPTVFDRDNQRSEDNYVPVAVSSSSFHVIPRDALIEQKEYSGFNLAEWGEIAVTYNKDDIAFFYNFKFVCLNRQVHNNFYPEPYLAVCFELELEGSGGTKEIALDELYRLLDVYFNRTREIHEKPSDYLEAIAANINRQNFWKHSFAYAYRRAQKLEKFNVDYQHRIM